MASLISVQSRTPPTEMWAAEAVQILLEVSESMVSADGAQSRLNRLAWLALRATGADRCAILVPDGDSLRRLIPAAGSSRTGDLVAQWQRFLRMEPISFSDELARSLESLTGPRAINDVDSSPMIPHSWKLAWDSKSIAYAPLRAGGELYGLLAVEYVESRHSFSPGELSLLAAIAGAAGVALRGANLVDQLQRAVSIERRLSECTTALRSDGSLAEILDTVADRFVSLLPETSCAIVLLSADGSTLSPVAFRGIPPRGDLHIADLPAEHVADFARTWKKDPHRPLLIPDVRAHPGWEPFVPPEVGTGMLLPLPEGDEIRGFVAVGRPSKPFTEEEARVATAFADHASIALSQARLTEALQLRLKVTQALFRLSDTVARTSDLRSVVSVLNREITRDVGIECTRIALKDQRLADNLRAHLVDATERDLLRQWRRDGNGVVLHERGTAVCVPIQNRPSGVLWVKMTRTDPTYVDLVKAIAAGIGDVAYKARLRRTAEERWKQLAVAEDRERIARDLHDTVGQTLYGIGLKLQDVLYDVDDPELSDRLSMLRGLAAQGVADVRSAVYALSFLHVRDRGFVPSLRALARQFRITTGVDVQVRVSGTLPSLNEHLEGALYRVAHEALVNVERHARATGVILLIESTDSTVTLTIKDDGVGLGQRDGSDWRSAAHFGMRTMAKSVEEVGGTFVARDSNPRGLAIQAIVPLGGTALPKK